MKTNNKFLKWMKKGENWIPFTVFGGILTAVILSWMTIFFVEYGAYFNEGYQKSLFKRSDIKEDGPLLETEYVYIDGELTWSVFSSFGFKFGDIASSYSEITDENGNGQLLEIDYQKQLLRLSEVNGDKTTELSTEPAPSRQYFMVLAFDVELPVNEMSFKPKMSNISVFKKDNALVSYATMPSDKR